MHEAARQNNKLLRTLQTLAKLRRIKNYDELLRDDLIYTLFRTEKIILEDHYMKCISNTANNEIHKNINIVRERIPQLGSILTK